MAGYTRQDTADNIANGKIIDADDLDSEFDAVESAFNSTTGHNHDGTTGEGARIAAVGPAGEMTVTATAIQPASDNALDLGTGSVEMKDGFFDGTIKTDELIVDETSTFTGAVTTSAAVSVGTTLTVASDLTVDGTTLHVDSTNNRVGLGLTSPDAELHIKASTPQVRLQPTADTQNSRIEFTNAAGTIQSRITSGGVDGQTIHLEGNNGQTIQVDVTGSLSVSGTVDGRDVAADGTKLDGIEANATADQSASEIRTLVESATDSNVFTDADHSKLNGIATGADVTGTANVTAAGALMDAECSSVSSLKAINQALTTTSSPTFNTVNVSGNISLTGTLRTSGGSTILVPDNAPYMRDHDNSGRIGVEGNGTGYTQRLGASGTNILWKWSKGTSATPVVMGSFDADGELTCVSTNITSDERVKSNIVDANSQWSDIKDLRLCNYTMNDSGQTHLGVIAQEAQVVSPGMVRYVSEDRDGSLLGINTSALMMKMLGALQEAMARIEELEAG